MADGSPPNKRQKTIGATDASSYDLENELPDDLLGSGPSNSGLTNGPTSGAIPNQVNSSQAGQPQAHPGGPPLTSMPHPKGTNIPGPKQNQLKQLLKSDRNSPKYAGTPSPGQNNANSSPRNIQPHQSPMHPIQSPSMSGTMNMNMTNLHGMASPQNQNVAMPGSLPRPNSTLNTSATPSPRPGSNHIVNSSMSNSVGAVNSMNNTNMIQNPIISSSMNNLAQQQLVSTQQTMPMVSQNNMLLNSLQQPQHQLMNGGISNTSNMGQQQTIPNGPVSHMARPQQTMNNNNLNQPNYMQTQMPNMTMQGGNNNAFNNSMQIGQPHKMPPNNFGTQSGVGIQPNSVQPMINKQTFMTRPLAPNNIMAQQGGNTMINPGMGPQGMNNSHMIQQMDQHSVNQFNNGGAAGMQANNGMPQNPPGNQGPSHVNMSNVNVQPGGMQSISQTGQLQQSNQVNMNKGMGMPNSSSDPEKRRLIQQQLVLLLHAYKCSKKEEKGEVSNCALPHCRTMKDVLGHMNNCTQGKSCRTAHCASSRQIIAHWTGCKRSDCVVCLPLKNAHNNTPTSNNLGVGVNPNFQSPVQANLAITENNSYIGDQNRSNFQKCTIISGMNGITNLSPQVPPILQIDGVGQNQGQDLGGMFQITPPRKPRDWHKEVTDELRVHLVRKLVQAIIPQPQKFSITDDRMKKLVAFARKVEGDMYEQASNRGEYYHLLAEKIYKIQKELEEKRITRRKPEIQKQQSQAGTQGVATSAAINSNSIAAPMDRHPPESMQMDPKHIPPAGSLVEKFREAETKMLEQNSIGDTAPRAVPHASVHLTTPTQSGIAFTSDSQPFITPSQQINKPSQLEHLLKRKTPPSSNDQLNQINTALSMAGSTLPKNSFGTQAARSMMSGANVNSTLSNVMTTTASSMPLTTSLTSSTSNSLPTVSNSSGPTPFVSGAFTSNNFGLSGNPNTKGIKEEPNTDLQSIKPPSVQGQDPLKTKPSTPLKPNVPKSKKEFSASELRESFLPIVNKLYHQEPEAAPFRFPVDPDILNIPDYFEIVKHPMDLETIRVNLETGNYKEPWQFVDHIWLMFNNAWLYNRRTSRVYKYCTRLKEIFEQEIDSVMQGLGYCCGRKLEFMPMTLCCCGKQLCTIPTGATYYEYQNSTQRYGLISDRYDYCEKCFNDIQGDSILIGDDPTQSQSSVSKSAFEKKKNNVLDPEPFVNCGDCGRMLHQICVLHNAQIWPEFVCDKCFAARGSQRKPNKFTASKLPQNKLSEHIERRVNKYLKENDKNGEAGHVHVRVVYVGDKTVEVRPGMKARYVDTKEMPESFPYRAKAFFAFEEIDGVDVCFFGVHVQEFGSDAPHPNQRRVYLSYLDSVHFFRPRHLRTAVYHEILIGYFEYCKNLGYEYAHIWACPPCEGDDYIFHCHPPEQKIPKPKRLQEWYKKMLDKAITDHVVVDYKDIFHQAKEDRIQSARELPYFEGDFWPNVLEECIKELEQEEADRREAEATEQASVEDGACANSKNGKKTRPKKGNNKKASQRSAKKKIPAVTNDLSDKLYQLMEKHKEVFFVMRLNLPETISKIGPTTDPDGLQSCELMDGRDAFLTMAREKHYEFSSLRRTKWSTMAMLVELHMQGQDRFMYTCNHCKNSVEAVDTRFHCTVCEDYDLCSKCYQLNGHNHKMEQMEFGMGNGGPSGTSSSNSKSNNQPVQRCMQSLVHACQCRNANCNMVACKKMKKIVHHARICKRKTSGTCQICKQLIALCCYHAKHCQETKCSVAFCHSIKEKLKKQEQQQRLQQAALMRRRMALMSRNIAQSAAPSTPNNAPSTPQDAHTPKLNDKAQSSPMTHDGMLSKGGPPQMPMQKPQLQQTFSNDYANHNQMQMHGGGMQMQGMVQQQMSINSTQMPQPGMTNTIRTQMQQNPPQAAVRAAKEAEQLARQQAQNINQAMQFGGARNQTPMQNVQQQQPRPAMSVQQVNNYPRGMNMNQFNVQNANPGQMNPQHNNQSPSASNEDLQKLVNLLKRDPQQSPGGIANAIPNKKIKHSDQVLSILKKNPQLMATFIKNKKLNRGPNQPPQQQVGMNMQQMPQGMNIQQPMQPMQQPMQIQQQPMPMQQPMQPMQQSMNDMSQPNMMQHPMQQGGMQPMQRQNWQMQQQQQFSQPPAPPYNQAIQQQRMMRQQPRFQRPHSMSGHPMQQGMMSHVPQQHPVMMTGVPQVNNQQQSVNNSRPPSQPGLSPHPMSSPHHAVPGPGRTTPLGQGAQVMNQGGMPNMGGSMDQQFNPNSQGGMMTSFNRPMGNMGQMNPHMSGFNNNDNLSSNAMSVPEPLDKFVND